MVNRILPATTRCCATGGCGTVMPASYGTVVYGTSSGCVGCGQAVIDGAGCPPGGCGEVVYEDGEAVSEQSTTVEAPEAPAEEGTSSDLSSDREA